MTLFGCPQWAFEKNAFKPVSSFLVQACHPQATRQRFAPPDVIKSSRTNRKWLESSRKCHLWKRKYHHSEPARLRENNRCWGKEFHRNSCHCKFHRRIILAVHAAILFIQWNLEPLITDWVGVSEWPSKHCVWHKTLHHYWKRISSKIHDIICHFR